jgi:hypothetical protein
MKRIKLKKEFNSIIEAQEFLNMNVEKILNKFSLFVLDN